MTGTYLAPSAITFKGGLEAPFHRWFRLTPSFSPDLVNRWLTEHVDEVSPLLLDPFSGAGTTAIVAKARRIESIAVEINPLLAFVSRTCVEWSGDAEALSLANREVVSRAKEIVESAPMDLEEFSAAIKSPVPPIHNVLRWWRVDVLRELMAIKVAIEEQQSELRGYLRLALAQIIYSSANITLGRLQTAFVNRDGEEIRVFDPYTSAVSAMVEDLTLVGGSLWPQSTIHLGDSTALSDVEDASVGAVFTSPPYPNRYSYVWNTRPHLYLLDFFTTPKEAASLDVRTIGGTWGTATSMHQKGVREPRPNVDAAAGPLIEQLHAASTLMGNYVTKYFDDLDLHLEALTSKVRSGSPIGYVVGNSETKDIMVETHDILAALMSYHGFSNIEQEILRKRHSGVGLTEVVVSARA